MTRLTLMIKLRKCEWNNHVLKMNHDFNDVENYKKSFDVYRNILEAFQLFKDVFQLLVLEWTFSTFVRSLSYTEILLQFYQLGPTNSMNISARLITLLWIIKNLLLETILCVSCENFYTAVEQAKVTCILRMKKMTCPESQKRLCMNVIRYNRASYHKMTASGLFDVDAALPLSVIETLTKNIIVLLQFALL